MEQQNTSTSDHFSGASLIPENLTMEALPEIEVLFARAVQAPGISQDVRRALVMGVITNNYIPILLDFFQIAEDLEDTETIGRVHSMLKSLILLNNPLILREILSDALIAKVAGVFECKLRYKKRLDRGLPGR